MTERELDPHGGQPVHTAGVSLGQAHMAVVMVHGRGASADSLLTLAPVLGVSDVAYLAPQAAGGTWYPYSFLAPIVDNEPGISSGMRAIGRVLETITEAGIPRDRTVLLGFSQGACLVTEYVARHPQRYGGVVSLSGGLIGPQGTLWGDVGSLDGTPVFLGCSDMDSHVPAMRVRDSADVLGRLGGNVAMHLYPGMGHTINGEELESVREMLRGICV